MNEEECEHGVAHERVCMRCIRDGENKPVPPDEVHRCEWCGGISGYDCGCQGGEG